MAIYFEMSASRASPTESSSACRSKAGNRNLAALAAISIIIWLQVSGIQVDGKTFKLEEHRQFGQTNYRQPDDLPEALALVASSSAQAGEKPRLIPLVAADSGYSENSSVNILCTVSQGHHESLTFDWFKDGRLLGDSASASSETSSTNDNDNEKAISGAGLSASSLSGGSSGELPESSEGKIDDVDHLNASGNNNNGHKNHHHSTATRPKIEKHSDHSLLRISRVHFSHSGRYTCSAKNSFGSDSSSVNLVVNVKLQWVREPPKELVVSVGQEIKVDCLAFGEPKPTMKWEKLIEPTSFASSSSSSSLSTSMANRNAHRRQQQHADSILMLTQSGAPSGNNQLAQLVSGAGNNNLLLATSSYTSGNSRGSAVGGGANNNNNNNLLVSSTRYLTIQRARETDSGLYECVASNSRDSDLRKLVNVQVRGGSCWSLCK